MIRTHYYPETISTNQLAKEADAEGDSFEIFVTDRQTAGYGRQGRRWDSPPGNLAFTLLWRGHGLAQKEAPKLSLVTAVAVARGLQKLVPEGVSIKWPNDIFIDGRKVSGILVEQAAGGALAIGIGINVNSTLENFAENVRRERMTLSERLGRSISCEEVFTKVIRLLIEQLERFQRGDWPGILDECCSLSFLTGREIEVEEGEGVWRQGRGEGIDDDGLLLFLTPTGLRRIAAGNVRVRER